MKNNIYLYTILSVILYAMSSCTNNDDSINPNERGTITLHFDNVAGDEDVELGTKTYLNASAESFTVTSLKYFISNIKFKAGSTEFVVPQAESYFMIDESDEESQDILLTNIPANDYSEVEFTIGVDSIKSVSDLSLQTGVLDPNSDMYWTPNEGYIFFKMEGTSTASSNSQYLIEVGGYGGLSNETKTFNNVKTITLSLGSDRAKVRDNINPEVHLYVDILDVFTGNTTFKIAEHEKVQFTEYSTSVANNYKSMFSYGHVHNEPK